MLFAVEDLRFPIHSTVTVKATLAACGFCIFTVTLYLQRHNSSGLRLPALTVNT